MQSSVFAEIGLIVILTHTFVMRRDYILTFLSKDDRHLVVEPSSYFLRNLEAWLRITHCNISHIFTIPQFFSEPLHIFIYNLVV